MICPNCGKSNEDGAVFCFNCGTNMNAQSQPVNQQNFSSSSESVTQIAQENMSMPTNDYQQNMYYNYNFTSEVGPTGYPIPVKDQTLRCVGWYTMLCATIGFGILLIPLAWMIPMTVHAWRVFKGRRANRTAFGICTLIFCGILPGILFLCSIKEDKMSFINQI